ncbi:C2 domain protein [Ancylostoma duodenale]|uniref:C2 domain protein n=1 Tax=Ancylostoma duodenale TaxID=51022 RepID=A0A0C2GCG2_9BILA|nr:C2 domain protein [Ancylostoma duodenale]
MKPVPSWICGIQSVALNMQTAGEVYPRSVIKPKVQLGIRIISAQYLPKSAPGKDIIDPYVSIQIFGVPRDEFKEKTKVIKDNGFNPQWEEGFVKDLFCPELAILRFCVKDWDSTTVNDFIGEYSIPVCNMRKGYSQIRLNTGFHHDPDECASLFVQIMLNPL